MRDNTKCDKCNKFVDKNGRHKEEVCKCDKKPIWNSYKLIYEKEK